MCQEFAVPNCVESATFDPAKSLTEASKSITHHFQVQKHKDKCTLMMNKLYWMTKAGICDARFA